MISQLIETPLCWVMVVTAWFTYQSIFISLGKQRRDSMDTQDSASNEMIPSVLVGALPLMGLLGTISGLQLSFTGMMSQGIDSQLVTKGIADALFTTQLGLVLAIPGWLLMALAKRKRSPSLLQNRQGA
ncbi:MotA/TolQ/ExbB proton channel family protein [Alteromonas sp. 009811495]|uniref:MotA/TolQ/ExbB proton channel family protein n=1 Tax=Alteromonas sp. 009811495 TaxID=3002962 RepID=UPI00237E7C9B|nr:MotA/TolQ/ExbB proton channel family protein [Alteromonas sp. 009811495]WDT85746.1 MotA/TolQ/ExbB proton channel family protein [Alteromonas sp. 009811495]